MMELDWIQLIGSLGFPIVVSIYLLTKFEKTLTSNTEALNSLKDLIKERLK
jgi:hypothetical protein